MLEINNAIRSFWLQFGIPVFFQNLVEENATFPYITFEYSVADFAKEYAISARLWTRDASHPRVLAGFSQIYWDKLQEMQDAISPNSGVLMPMANEKGTILLTRGTPFIVHNVPDEIRSIKSALINLNVKYYTN